jgi:protein-disulfide isomerase
MPDINDETITFRFKRIHFYAAAIPLAFIAGLAVGFLQWGSQSPEIAASSSNSAQTQLVSEAGDAPQEPEVEQEQSIADQIAGIERYDIEISETDPSFGPEDALVTIIEFSDFECPFCKSYFEQTHPQLIENYEGRIRFVYKDLPLTSIHPNAAPASNAALCAFEQDAFWPFHDLLFGGSLELGRASYEEYASQLGLDMQEFILCLDEERYADVVQADMEYALEIGARSTPTFFINGIGLVGAQPFEVFAQIIDHELGISAE